MISWNLTTKVSVTRDTDQRPLHWRRIAAWSCIAHLVLKCINTSLVNHLGKKQWAEIIVNIILTVSLGNRDNTRGTHL